MYRYQFRAPSAMSVADVIDDIANKTWLLFQHRLESEQIPDTLYSDFHSQIHRTIGPFLKAYNVCCEQTKISSPPDAMNERITHLALPIPLTHLIEELVTGTFTIIRSVLRTPEEKARAILDLVFRSVLGQYVFGDDGGARAGNHHWTLAVNPWEDAATPWGKEQH